MGLEQYQSFVRTGVLVSAGFSLAVGSGGYPQLQEYYGTGNSDLFFTDTLPPLPVSAPIGSELQTAQVPARLKALLHDYGLGKDQLSELLSVSRPTLYTWLEGMPGEIKESNRARIGQLARMLDAALPPAHRDQLGRFLRRRLDVKAQALRELFVKDVFDEPAVISALSETARRLEGLQRAASISEALSDRTPYL